MIIRIHRWQERQNRFHVQKIILEDFSDVQGETFFGAIFDARQGMMPGFKNFRTQKVDRIEINSLDGSIAIYTSATVERKENKRSRKVNTEAAMKVYEPLCSHDPNTYTVGFCDCPKCNTPPSVSNNQVMFSCVSCLNQCSSHDKCWHCGNDPDTGLPT